MQKYAMIGLMMAILVLLMPVKIPAEEAGHGSKGEVLENRHGIELFLGNTQDDGENGFSVGLSYEYRLNQLFGIGGIVEYAGGDFKKWTLGVPFFLHPYKGWRFLVAPGVSIPDNDDDDEFLFRVGAAYEFEIGEKWANTPEFNVDFVDNSEELVYGLSFGYKF